MASQQGSLNPSSYSSGQLPGQAQMRRNDLVNQPSDTHNQELESTFLQDTGAQIKNMAQGAAQGAVNIARGAAAGAANLATGAADAVKNTLGMNDDNTHSPNDPNWPNEADWPGNTNRAATNNPGGPINPSNPRI